MIQEKPTIYKPGAYKTPSIYKSAGGIYKGRGVYNDGSIPPAPDDILLLDYFNGWSYGPKLQKSADYEQIKYMDSEAHNLNAIPHSIFGDFFPAARFDLSQDTSKDSFIYEIDVTDLNYISIEYLIRYSADHPTINYGASVVMETDDRGFFQEYFPASMGNSYMALNRLDSDGNYPWSGQIFMGNDLFHGESSLSPTSWKHVLISFNFVIGYLDSYINGSLRAGYAFGNNYRPKKIKLMPYVFNVNDPSTKNGWYDIAQLAVWRIDKTPTPYKLIIGDE